LPSFSQYSKTVEKIEYTSDPFDLQDDEETEVNGKNLAFIFIVDRSGSMGGMKIELVKEALQLFMQCLPSGCSFKIISFGSSYDCLNIKGSGNNMVLYSDATSKDAID
jgi:uncharacterized protein with von Willebrand factor type A (vWA) domain